MDDFVFGCVCLFILYSILANANQYKLICFTNDQSTCISRCCILSYTYVYVIKLTVIYTINLNFTLLPLCHPAESHLKSITYKHTHTYIHTYLWYIVDAIKYHTLENGVEWYVLCLDCSGMALIDI